MDVLDEVRYAWRTLRRSLGFALAAIAMLALTIGASTAIFTVVDATLLRQVPFKDPDRLVLLWGTEASSTSRRSQVSVTDVYDWSHRSRSFEHIAIYQGRSPMLTDKGSTERVSGLNVSDGFFDVLGARPFAGRFFDAAEFHAGHNPVVVLSYDFWRRHFRGDRAVVGTTIALNYRACTIVGVAPPDLHALPTALTERVAPTAIYTPLAGAYDEPTEPNRTARHLRAIARLKPGVTLAQAQADLDLVQTEIVREHPREDAGNGVRVVTLRDDVVRNIRTSLLILQGAVLIVVLIACANIANLLLARSTARRREIAIRSALGARKSRLVRQMLIESLLLGVIGGGGGLLLASWAVSALTALGASVVPELNDVAISVPVVAFAFGLSLVAGVIFGAAPAMHFSAERPNEALKAGGRAIGPSLADRRTRNWLVATEVAMSVVLLVCAGLLVKSFVLLQQVNPGFDAKGVIVADVSLPAVRYSEIPQQQEYFRSALRKAAELPGIESVALVTTLPESSDFDMVTMEIKGRTFAAGNLPNPDRYVVSPGYFHAFRIPLVRGRAFGADDDSGHPRVVIVNQQLADALFPGQDPIGQQVEIPTPGTFAPGQQPYWTIVGVVGNVKQYGLASNQTMQIYVPYLQYDIEGATLIGRAAQTPTAALVAELRRTVRAIDADVYVSDPQLMDEVLAQSLSSQRFSMALLTVFGVGALLLAMLGVYSVVSFVVAQRSAELGVRMALGAGAADVVRVVVVQGMRPVVAGLIAGAAIAFVAARLVEPFLFHTNPHDALASAIVVAVLATSAGVACSVPALRATRIDPLMALRAE